jgi:transposase
VHPLRSIKGYADSALESLSRDFDALYATTGRPSIPPERLLKASLLIALYSVRSDRLFCEMLDYNILFRWFLDMNLEEHGLDQSNFSRLRERLVESNVAVRFFDAVVGEARKRLAAQPTLPETGRLASTTRPYCLANRRPPSAGIAEELSRRPSRPILAVHPDKVNRDSEIAWGYVRSAEFWDTTGCQESANTRRCPGTGFQRDFARRLDAFGSGLLALRCIERRAMRRVVGERTGGHHLDRTRLLERCINQHSATASRLISG